jgi:hypothetical protein
VIEKSLSTAQQNQHNEIDTQGRCAPLRLVITFCGCFDTLIPLLDDVSFVHNVCIYTPQVALMRCHKLSFFLNFLRVNTHTALISLCVERVSIKPNKILLGTHVSIELFVFRHKYIYLAYIGALQGKSFVQIKVYVLCIYA